MKVFITTLFVMPRLLCLYAWLIAMCCGCCIQTVFAQGVEFDAAFMQSLNGASAPKIDLKLLTENANIMPGAYPVTIFINQSYFARRELMFDFDAELGKLQPCLSAHLLTDMGVRIDTAVSLIPPDEACVAARAISADAAYDFDSGKLTLAISIPQLNMTRDVATYVDPTQWDRGIDAAMLSYQVSASNGTVGTSNNQDQYSVYLNGGFNWGDWRFRSNAALQRNGRRSAQWQNGYNYVQRDLPGTLGQFTLGQSYTPSDTFDSVPFKGLQVATDPAMLPDTMQGYAPVIRGIANSRAKVDVHQNRFLIYTTFVSPGPFEIVDLNTRSGSGDLVVTITESNGKVTRFVQPFSTMTNLLREDAWRYSAALGYYDAPARPGFHPAFLQVTAGKGVGWDATVYGGLMAASFYRAVSVGIGKNLGRLGALSVDMINADSMRPEHVDERGQSYRLQYSKTFETATSFRLAGSRYSESGYRSFDEVARQQVVVGTNELIAKRSQVSVSIAQNVSCCGSLYVNLNQRDFWTSSRVDREIQAGFTTQFKSISAGIYFSSTRSRNAANNNQIMFSVNIPMGTGASVSYNPTLNRNGSFDHQLGITGRLNEDNRFTYNLNASRSANNGTNLGATNGSGSVNYASNFGQVGLGFSVGTGAGTDYRQTSANLSGSMLLHAGGVYFGPSLGETSVLVEVPQTKDVGLVGALTKTNADGFGVIPYVVPYRKNRVELDSSLLDVDTDIENSITTVIPRRGAIVKTTFEVSKTSKVLATITTQDGVAVPFAARVLSPSGELLAMIGPAGRALLSLGAQAELMIIWGDAINQKCRLPVKIDSTMSKQEGFYILSLTCFPLASAEQP